MLFVSIINTIVWRGGGGGGGSGGGGRSGCGVGVVLQGQEARLEIGYASLLSGEPDYFGRNKILSGYDLSHYQVPYCIRVFFYFVWFVFIHHNFQFYFKLCTYCTILDIYLS